MATGTRQAGIQRKPHHAKRRRTPAFAAGGGSRSTWDPSAAAQRGYTLIEVLVAVVVLSIGLLGLALLTGMSLQDNTRAYQRSIAVFLAYDIADRMRANPQGMIDGAYEWKLPHYKNPSANKPGCGSDKVCSPDERRALDLHEWALALRLGSPKLAEVGLPKGSAKIEKYSEDPLIYTVTVQWQEAPGRGGAGRSNAGQGCPDALDKLGFSCLTLRVRP